MKLMVVGGGGREHAIIKKLKENPSVEVIYALPGNGGIAADAVCVDIGAKDIDGIVAFAKEKKIDFAVVAPDDPLVLGAVDALEAAGIRSFGPKKNAAIIEGSKVFAKNLMKKYGIPTAAYEVFEDMDAALAYLETAPVPTVIKADGLALGKGVIIAASHEEAKEGLHEIMEEKVFGTSGNHVVVEEFLTGPEVSVLAFVDGKTVVPMVSSMDHKRALDGDKGLNTGGMGTIAPNPFYTPEVAQECMEKIFKPTVAAMASLGRPFKGCLYFGLMLTPKGPYVIEYNSRFGDPETQVVLELLDSDLVEIMEAVYNGTLTEEMVHFSDEKAACVIIASGGYPKSYRKGLPISGLDAQGQREGVSVYHSGTKLTDGVYYNNGGRVLGVTARAQSLQEALDKAYESVDSISFEDCFSRRDIGKRALQAK